MKFVVAIDSFKGSASSAELNLAVKEGIQEVLPGADVDMVAIADGGEGTISALQASLGGQLVSVTTLDLLGRTIEATYLLAGEIAIIEVANVVGIDKVAPSLSTISTASTIGLAKLMLDAKARGVSEIILSLGGSGTSDGGLGLLVGLGAEVTNDPQESSTNRLMGFKNIDLSKMVSFSGIKISALADVTNVYAGASGFAEFFGRQKGGDDALLAKQNHLSQEVVHIIRDKYKIDLQAIEGTGAAGGIGGAVAILGGQIEPGFQKIAQLIKLDERLNGSELVITGEGRMDFQTANGKVPYGMAKLAESKRLPIIAFCGALGDDLGMMNDVLLAIYSIQREVVPLDQAMDKQYTLANMQSLAANVFKTRFKN